MIITYTSVTGEVTEVEVDASIGAVIIDSRREEASGDRKYRRHNWSLDAITYEGIEFGTEDIRSVNIKLNNYYLIGYVHLYESLVY